MAVVVFSENALGLMALLAEAGRRVSHRMRWPFHPLNPPDPMSLCHRCRGPFFLSFVPFLLFLFRLLERQPNTGVQLTLTSASEA